MAFRGAVNATSFTVADAGVLCPGAKRFAGFEMEAGTRARGTQQPLSFNETPLIICFVLLSVECALLLTSDRAVFFFEKNRQQFGTGMNRS